MIICWLPHDLEGVPLTRQEITDTIKTIIKAEPHQKSNDLATYLDKNFIEPQIDLVGDHGLDVLNGFLHLKKI